MKFYDKKIAVFGLGLGALGLGFSALVSKSASAAPPAQVIPFAEECSTSDFDTAGRAECLLAAIPAGYHLEIQTVTGQFQLTSGVKPIQIDLQIQTHGGVTDNFFPASFQGDSAFFTGDFYTVNQAVGMIADSGSTPLFTIVVSNTADAFVSLTVAGKLVKD